MAKKNKDVPKFDDTEPVFDDTEAISPEDQDTVAKYISQPEVPMLESARAGLANGGTFGFAPRIGAAGGALASAAQQKLSNDQQPQSLKDLYNEYLKMNNDRQSKAQAGNPITYGAAQLAGGFASPMNKVGAVADLGKNASTIAKMGTGVMGGARLGGLAGLSQSPDLTNIPEDAKAAGLGSAIGMGMGAAVPPVGVALKGLASGTANMVRPLIGKPGEMFSKGMNAGMEGAPNLAGEPGQLQAIQERGKFADQFVNDLHEILASHAKNKRQLISDALQKSQLAPKEAVDAVMQKYLQANPQLNEESARKELAHLKDMIITAAEGPKKTEVVRHYNPSEMQSANNELVGHKKVLSREIDPEAYLDIDPTKVNAEDLTNPKTQKDLFEADVAKKKAEIRALPGHAVDPDSIEVHYEPIEGSDKVMAVARSPVYKENTDAFSGAPASSDDMQQFVREGGRNLQDPQELYNLQKNLQAKSQFSEGRGFSSQEMNKMSGDAAKDVAQLIKMTIPESVPVDERLNAFNNVAESLGVDTNKLNLPGGEGQKARQDAMKKILSVLTPESLTDKSQLNQQTIDYVKNQLNRAHPDIGNAFEQEAAKHTENAGTINELVKPQTVGGGGPILSSIRRGLNKTAYGMGHAIGSKISEVKPHMDQTQQIFKNYAPDALQRASQAAVQSTNQTVQQLGQVLGKLATADDRTRNSMMFVLEQQAGYRQLMAPYFEKNEPGTPQAKDKTLEKYK